MIDELADDIADDLADVLEDDPRIQRQLLTRALEGDGSFSRPARPPRFRAHFNLSECRAEGRQ